MHECNHRLLLTWPETITTKRSGVSGASGVAELGLPRRSVSTDAALQRLHVHNARDLASACGNIAPGKHVREALSSLLKKYCHL